MRGSTCIRRAEGMAAVAARRAADGESWPAGRVCGKQMEPRISDKAAPCPLDHVNGRFHAPRPNALWVSDFTYVSTLTGSEYVAFVIDAFTRRIVGGLECINSACESFVLDALEQALHDRQLDQSRRAGALQRSRGSPISLSQVYRAPGEAGVEPSVAS